MAHLGAGSGRHPSVLRLASLFVLALTAAAPASVLAHDAARQSQVTGKTTLEQRITGDDPTQGWSWLRTAPGEPYVVREELAGAQDRRDRRRVSLAYFGQITDMQFVDEESPSRVEFTDIDPSGTASAAYRPQEAFVAHVTDWTVRQMNRFTTSPVTQRGGARAQMVNAVMTGDLADNMQRNETEWVLRVLAGGTLDPNSGTADFSGTNCPPGTPVGDPREYHGVQDYALYGGTPAYYDPNQPTGQYATWPRWENLMDRAQRPFEAEGLRVPFYVAFGNHDGLAQGNEDAIRPFEDVGIGCVKPLAPAGGLAAPPPEGGGGLLSPLASLGTPAFMIVPPDPARQYVDKRQFKEIFAAGRQTDDHGFAHIDRDELRASNGAAAYYAWTPTPGVRFIVLDTLSEGGVVGVSSNGNIDDPQFRWLERELTQTAARDELVVVFGHHAKSSLFASVPDELAPPCVSNDQHGHDLNPGCDRDPRNSQPVHGGDDTEVLLGRFPHVVAYVAGHSHENRVAPLRPSGTRGYWEIKSPAVIDWPPQHRLIEVMDNCDGTLSIFGTVLDAAAPVRAPDAGSAAAFSDEQLAAIGRTLTWNDPQQARIAAEGEPTDRNVELLLRDPRRRPPGVSAVRVAVTPRIAAAGRRTRFSIRVTGVVEGQRRALEGAVVRFAGRRAETDARGRTSVVATVRGRRIARATGVVGCSFARGAAAVRAAQPASYQAPRSTG